MRTPSQTVGPFFAFALCTHPRNALVGGSVRVAGQVFDGDGAPIGDAMLEVWSPDGGWARCGTDDRGAFSFLVPEDVERLELMVFGRGLLKPALTRVHLGGGERAADPTMVARQEETGYRFDVHMQGERATAFFRLD